jgi:hypothetical protein
MKRFITLLGLVGLVVTFLPSCAPAAEPDVAPEPVFDPAAEEAAVRKADEIYNAAWSAHDAKAIVATRDESEESWEGTIKHGEDDSKILEAGFAGPFKNVRSKLLKEIGVVFVTPEVAIYKGVYEFGGILDKEGNEVPATKNLYARVYVKRDGKWLGAGYFFRPMEE